MHIPKLRINPFSQWIGDKCTDPFSLVLSCAMFSAELLDTRILTYSTDFCVAEMVIHDTITAINYVFVPLL